MVTSIDVKFIFDLRCTFRVVQLRKYSPKGSCLLAVLAMFLAIIRLVLSLGTSEMFAIFVFTTKTTQPRPQVFSVNGALTCKVAALLTLSVD